MLSAVKSLFHPVFLYFLVLLFLCSFPSHSADELFWVVGEDSCLFPQIYFPQYLPILSKIISLPKLPICTWTYHCVQESECYNVSRTGPLGHCCDHGIGTYNQKEEHARIAARNGSHILSNAAVQGTLIYSGA